ncbi:right-handed parallel beta-helix repeat-containing protein [Methanobrevibacter sp.]|uniref:right-handed parallel beta-helix repeat-containing protein n=1 Tax=Methanobrevibacter sp. TaxID=66852 RepID=UPI00386B452B
MNLKRNMFLLSLLLVALLCISSVVAMDDNNFDNNNLTADSSVDVMEYSNEDTLAATNTITVDKIGEDHNEMNDKTIKKAFDDAKDGDTIIINGNYYEHVHRVIDKRLTIKSEVGTSFSHCSNQGGADSGHQGIFYLTSKASGTVIEGFNFINDNGMLFDSQGYSILIDGASNVIIRNCTFSNNGVGDCIRLENANGITIDDVTIADAVCGVNVKNSNNVVVENSDIKNHKVAAVSVSGSSKNTTIIYNNLTNSGVGVNLTSSNYVYILSNYIAYNTHGVYVNCNVTKIEIKGNFFNQNKMYEVLNDYRVRNLVDTVKRIGYPNREIIDNNYMVGLEGAQDERPVFRITYDYKGANKGDYSYDAAKDIYKYVGDGKGDYTDNKGAVFLRYVFEINKNVNCPVIFYKYEGGVQWSLSGNYELKLSEIRQVRKGIYSISIIDENGNVAKDLSSVPVTFYLNKETKHIKPDEGDIYRTVMMVNGTATAKFYKDEFSETGNVITAVVPANGVNFDDKISKTFTVDDAYIPGTPSNTTLTVSNLNTYPSSNQQLIVTLKDSNGNPIAGETLTIKLNSKTYTPVTGNDGKAKIKVSIAKVGTYKASIVYAGDDVNYLKSSAKANVVVKKQATKIVSSNLNMIPKMAEYFSITLKDGSGKAIAKQRVTFKVNGKSYTRTTNAKGVAKVKLKFSKNKKTYKITIKYKGNKKFKAASKTNKILVKYSSKTAKLSTPTVTITPKTSKTYTVTLKDAKGKAIAKQKVVVKINGKKYTKKTNSKGKVSIKVKFSKIKNYKVSATYSGNKIYKKASSSGKIKVAKTKTKITAPTVSTTPKEAKTYTITLKTSSGKAISKQKVTIKVNGKTYTKTTNSKGKASISVKLPLEKSYGVSVNYKGNAIYKASKATGKVKVAKIATQLESYNKTYSADGQKLYRITLKDKAGKVLSNQNLMYWVNGENATQRTDADGKITVDLSNQKGKSFEIITIFGGNNKYKPVSKINTITISDKTGVTFVDSDLPNSEIQDILSNAPKGSDIEFLGDYYFDICLEVNNNLNIYSLDRTILNAKDKNPVFNVVSNNVNITGFSIKGNSGDAIIVNGAKNVVIKDNFISNSLDEGKIESYADGTVNMPGYGITVSDSSNVKLLENDIALFESGIFAEYSNQITIDDNSIRENNYGIKYGFGVANTEITNNEISDQTGLYIMTVPEGPSGYGIFLNNSAVNVTINHNHIAWNHLGISLDANGSTGIVITQNTITDNVLEGMRFNAPYDLAENAVEPIVTDNAIYRNARGPSMMILGEMSANPEGIYGPGQWNESLRLKLDPNWYGTNVLVTWDYDTGVVGYGTMCPRISTTAIKFNNLTYNSPGKYSIVFYKNGEVASNLPEFDMYATLNRGTAKEVEVNFNVINGVGSFKFNPTSYYDANNIIEVSVGSLIDSTYRTFKITSKYEVPESEIPV